jgi:hypothetical protein
MLWILPEFLDSALTICPVEAAGDLIDRHCHCVSRLDLCRNLSEEGWFRVNGRTFIKVGGDIGDIAVRPNYGGGGNSSVAVLPYTPLSPLFYNSLPGLLLSPKLLVEASSF